VAWPAVLLLAGGTALAHAGLTNRSSGAVDNASGLLTALAVVDAQPPEVPVGVLFLDAEEYGLEGARALVRERAHLLAGTAIINLDGIDDRGRVIGLVHRPGRVTEAVLTELGATWWRWLPLFVDGLVLAPAARECVTIMRGDWNTARLVHTARDTSARLTLSGATSVAAGVARALASVLSS
jgi:Zn-dependent M28 family amino/carboxypeptidase